jgi:hypothetical protein
MPKLPAFGWPPGWFDKGYKSFFFYLGDTDTIVDRSPNVASIVKVGVGVYDVTYNIERNPGQFAGLIITVLDPAGIVPVGYTLQGLGPFTTRISTFDPAGNPIDAHISKMQFQVPDGWAE